MAGEEAVRIAAGTRIPYTPGSDVAAGDVIVLNNLVAIADMNISSGVLSSLAAEGVFEVPKVDGVAMNQGDNLYWDVAAKNAQKDADGGNNKLFAKCWESAASGATTVKARLVPRGD